MKKGKMKKEGKKTLGVFAWYSYSWFFAGIFLGLGFVFLESILFVFWLLMAIGVLLIAVLPASMIEPRLKKQRGN